MRATEPLDFRLLGPLEIRAGGEPLPLGGAKQRALIGVLLVHANEAVSTDRLIDALWSVRPPETAKTALQGYIRQLRDILEPERQRRVGELLATTPAGYLLRVEDGALDRDRFQALARKGHTALAGKQARQAAELHRSALELWRGPALAEFAYEAWAQGEAERLEEQRLVCLEERIEADLELGLHAELVGELEALIAEHPLREHLRRLLMLALYRSGRQADALDIYQQARMVLTDELGIDPSPELRQLEAAILRQDEALASPAVAAPPTTKLPTPPTRLVGRQRELAEVGKLLSREGTRLLTLTGPGGSGKTRLALALAERFAGHYRDGAWFVSLAPVSAPELLLPTVAATLEVSEQPERSLAETLAAALSEKELLLVLDNLEHLLAVTPALAELLAGCPQLTMLATSRSPLRLAAEQEYAVPPLAEEEAIELFFACARAHDPALNGSVDSKAGAEIVRRLEGLPLALELAAARVRLLGLDGLRDRLDQALPLLTGGPRDSPARQQTLRATIEWSDRLLGDEEQAALARISVFAGGFGIDAAEEVADASLDTLEALTSQSLLRVRSPGRFWLLHVIREYAAERLAESGDSAAVRERHATWILQLALVAEHELTGPEQVRWAARLETEHDNVRAALAWVLENAPTVALEIAGAIWRFWYLHGYFSEGRSWLDQALAAAPPDAPPVSRAKALNGAGALAGWLCEFDEAEHKLDEAERLLRASDEPSTLAQTLNVLGGVAVRRGEHERALPLLEESLELKRQAGDAWGASATLNNLGVLAFESGDLAAARRYGEETLRVKREIGDTHGLGAVLSNLGEIAVLEGRLEEADRLLAESLEHKRKLGDAWGIGACHHALGRLARKRGDYPEAARRLGEAVEIYEQLGDVDALTVALEALAEVGAEAGASGPSTSVLAACDRIWASEEASPPSSVYVAERDRVIEQLRGELGTDVFDRAWEVGRRLDRDKLVELARAELVPANSEDVR
jgi:predicted ATPase/DNA-binding SARP family transcriptional activator